MSPLAKKVSVYIDAVRFAEILGDERADCWKVLRFEFMLILNIAELGRQRFRRRFIHSWLVSDEQPLKINASEATWRQKGVSRISSCRDVALVEVVRFRTRRGSMAGQEP